MDMLMRPRGGDGGAVVGKAGSGRRAALLLQAGQGHGDQQRKRHSMALIGLVRCKLASVRLLSESWFYRRADSSWGEMQVSLMVLAPNTCKQCSLKKKG